MMRIPTLAAIAALTFSGTAVAAGPVVVSGGADDGSTAPVAVHVEILNSSNDTMSTLDCDWKGEPGDEDLACIKFQSDPQVAFRAIEAAGGDHAKQTTTTGAGTMHIAYARRTDNTWLIDAEGTLDGQPAHYGRVCTADGQSCAAWDANGAHKATKQIVQAATKAKAKAKKRSTRPKIVKGGKSSK